MPTRSKLKVLDEPRMTGERCCDGTPKPQMSAGERDRFVADLDILAHPVRLQLLDLLVQHEGRVCVCDLEAAVPVKQPTVSHHLRVLRDAGLVDSEKHGLWVYYFVKRPALAALRARVTEQLRRLG